MSLRRNILCKLRRLKAKMILDTLEENSLIINDLILFRFFLFHLILIRFFLFRLILIRFFLFRLILNRFQLLNFFPVFFTDFEDCFLIDILWPHYQVEPINCTHQETDRIGCTNCCDGIRPDRIRVLKCCEEVLNFRHFKLWDFILVQIGNHQ